MKTILFDLDGTLLPLDTDLFVQKYLEKLSIKMSRYLEPKIFIDKLLKATEAMIINLDDKTNEEVFIEHFFNDWFVDKEEIMQEFENFYLNEFKSLKSVAKPNPYALEILEHLKSKNINLVIATNPLFPLVAIKERLSWIDLKDDYFELITSYETMKYCKPHIQYYQQIVDIMGINPKECLMVGNDVQEDLVASKIGMKTFLVEDYLINSKNSTIETDYRGSFKDLRNFIFENI